MCHYYWTLLIVVIVSIYKVSSQSLSCNSGPIEYNVPAYSDISETYRTFEFEYLSSYDTDFRTIIISTCGSNSSLDTFFTLNGTDTNAILPATLGNGCFGTDLAYFKNHYVPGVRYIGFLPGETYTVQVGLENNPSGYTPGSGNIGVYNISIEIICESIVNLECGSDVTVSTSDNYWQQSNVVDTAVFVSWTYLGSEIPPINVTTCFTQNSNYSVIIAVIDDSLTTIAQVFTTGCPNGAAEFGSVVTIDPISLGLVPGTTYYIAVLDNSIANINLFPLSYRIGFECDTTQEECDVASGQYTVDWDSELTQSSSSNINTNLTSSGGFNSNGLFELTVTATADYVVRANYVSLDEYDFGVTYVLDTNQFEDADRVLFGEVGSCENRFSSEYLNLNINDDLWTYEIDLINGNFPGSNGLGMEYPESNWTLSFVDMNNICDGGVQWERTLSYNQLQNCNFTWSEDNNNIYFSGVFYLTLVSPQPIGYIGSDNLPDVNSLSTTQYQYITKQLESLEVVIQFTKALSIVSDGNVQLFGSFIISSDFNRDSNTFEVTILTYVPRYVEISDISSLSVLNSLDSDWSYIEDDSYTTPCFVQDDYRCWQKFIFSRTINECSNDLSVNLDDTMNILSNIVCVGEEEDSGSSSPPPPPDNGCISSLSCLSNADCGNTEECHSSGCCVDIPDRACNPASELSCPTVLFDVCGCGPGAFCTGDGGDCGCSDGYVHNSDNLAIWTDDDICVRCNVDRDCQVYLDRTNVECLNNDCIETSTGLPVDYSRRRLQDDAAACDEFLNNINDFQSSEINTGTLSFAYTEGCDDSLYQIDFSDAVSLIFYTDSTYTTEKTDSYDSNGATVYFQVSINSPFSNYNVLGFKITSAYLCTADLSSGTIPTSCVNPEPSDNIDVSLMYTLTTDSNVNWKLDANNNDTSDNTEGGSFALPLIADDTFFCEMIIELTLNNNNNNTRRRILLQNNNNINRYTQGFVSGTFISSNNDNSNNNSNKNNENDINFILLIVIIVVSIIVLLGGLFFGIYYCKYQKMKGEIENNHDAVIKVTSGSIDPVESNSNTATNTPTITSTNQPIKTFQPVTI